MFKRLPVWGGLTLLVLSTSMQAELRVIVTPTHVEKPKGLAVANLGKSTVSRELIKRDQFAGKLTSVAEVLDKHANITVRDNGGLGSYSTLSIRGSNSRQVLLLLDGVPINDASTGGVDLSQFSMDQFERVEIYKGNIPIEFGLTSAGGAVNLVTRKLQGKKTEIGIGGGGFEARKLSFSHNQSFLRSRIFFAADVLEAKNNFTFINNATTPDVSADDFSDKRINNEYVQRTAILKYGYDISARQSLNFSLNALDKTKNLPSNFNNPSANSDLSNQQQRYGINFQQLMDESGRFEVAYQGKRSKQQYRDVQGNIGLGKQAIDYMTPLDSLSLRFQKEWGTWRLHAQTAAQRERFKQASLPVFPRQKLNQINCQFNNPCDLSFSRNQWVAAIGGDKSFNQHKFSLSVNTKWVDDENQSQNAIVTGTGLSDEVYTTAQLGWAYEGPLTWRANASNSVRIPSSYELFGDTGFSKGNSGLKTEYSQLLELGLGYRQYGWVFDGTIYHRSIDDLIVPERDARGVSSYHNVSHATIFGWEALLEKHWLSGWNVGTKLSQINSNINSGIAGFDQRYIPGVFHFQTSSFISWNSANWDVEVQRKFSSGLFYTRTNLVKADNKNQTNMSIVYKRNQWRIDLSINNVFDERFHDFNDQPTEGRNVFVFSKFIF